MQPIRARVVESLRGFSDEALNRVTSSAGVFCDRRWFRMLDSLDTSALVGGRVEQAYVVATRARDRDSRVESRVTGEPSELLAVCPFMITRSPDVYFFYSLDKFFFSHWPEEAPRLNPDRERHFRRLARAVGLYRRLLRATGVRLDSWVLAASALSHRGGVALAPLRPAERTEVLRLVVNQLQDLAADENLPLCFFGIDEQQHELRAALSRHGCEETFLVFDNLLALNGELSLDDYLDRFKSDARRLFKREIRQTQTGGVTFVRQRRLSDVADQLAQLYATTYGRYGDEHFHHPAEFWSALETHLGDSAEALLAYHGSQLVGFSLLLAKNELWFYRVGRCYNSPARELPIYFSLAFYEPVKRAIELGLKNVWLGSGAWQAKHRRGAVGRALYSYLWWPRRWDRWTLAPYLSGFSQISRQEMSVAERPTSYMKASSLET